jgi:MoxR-like ATPase
MFKLIVNYPSLDDSKTIINRMTSGNLLKIEKVLHAKDVIEMQKFCKKIYCDDKITDYVARLVDATRFPDKYGVDVDGLVDFGASPRALIWLIMGAKTNAMLEGRGYVIPEDVLGVVSEVLRHRIIISYEAEAEGITSDEIIDKIVSKVKMP